MFEWSEMLDYKRDREMKNDNIQGQAYLYHCSIFGLVKDLSKELWADPDSSWWSRNAHWFLAAIGTYCNCLRLL